MSSVEFHEDEWGRSWSYSPALHGTQVRATYPLFSNLLEGFSGLCEMISERYAVHQAQALMSAKPQLKQDAFSEEDTAPRKYIRHEGVRDEFGRTIV